jgi:hypothetical protein
LLGNTIVERPSAHKVGENDLWTTFMSGGRLIPSARAISWQKAVMLGDADSALATSRNIE